jgi:hypothetical protein
MRFPAWVVVPLAQAFRTKGLRFVGQQVRFSQFQGLRRLRWRQLTPRHSGERQEASCGGICCFWAHLVRHQSAILRILKVSPLSSCLKAHVRSCRAGSTFSFASQTSPAPTYALRERMHGSWTAMVLYFARYWHPAVHALHCDRISFGRSGSKKSENCAAYVAAPS